MCVCVCVCERERERSEGEVGGLCLCMAIIIENTQTKLMHYKITCTHTIHILIVYTLHQFSCPQCFEDPLPDYGNICPPV